MTQFPLVVLRISTPAPYLLVKWKKKTRKIKERKEVLIGYGLSEWSELQLEKVGKTFSNSAVVQ